MSTGGAIRAGKAFILLRIRDETSQGLRTARRGLTSFAASTARVGLGLTAIGAGLTAFIKPTITEFSRAEQLLGRFDAVFGSLADKSGQFADKFGRDINQSGLVLRDELAQFQAVLQGFGISPEAAQPISVNLTKGTQDLVAFNDNITDAQQAVDKLLGGISGSNIRGVRSFGADIRDSNVAAELLRLGINKTTDEAGEMEKVLARVSIVLRALGSAGATGQAVREVNTLAARFRGLGAAVRDARVDVGATLATEFSGFVRQITDAVRGLGKFALANSDVVRAAVFAVPAITALGVTATVAAGGIFLATSAITALAAVTSSPILLGALGLAGAAVAADQLVTALTGVKSVANEAAEAFTDSFLVGAKQVVGVVNSITEALSQGQWARAGEIAGLEFKIAFAEATQGTAEDATGFSGFFKRLQEQRDKVSVEIAEFMDALNRNDPNDNRFDARFRVRGEDETPVGGIADQARQQIKDREVAEAKSLGALKARRAEIQRQQDIDNRRIAEAAAREKKAQDDLLENSRRAQAASRKLAEQERKKEEAHQQRLGSLKKQRDDVSLRLADIEIQDLRKELSELETPKPGDEERELRKQVQPAAVRSSFVGESLAQAIGPARTQVRILEALDKKAGEDLKIQKNIFNELIKREELLFK